jgi:MFS family permease
MPNVKIYKLIVQQTMSNALGGTSIDLFWVGTAYLLPCAIMQPFIAAVSDIFGRRPLLLLSLLLFTVGTLVCSLA